MARARLLLVEDDADQRTGLAELLRLDGHDVAEAESAEKAAALLESEPFDLIVVDYQLEGAPGTWVARLVAPSQDGSRPKAILITGHDEVVSTPALRVLRKPLDLRRLRTEIDRILGFSGDQPPLRPAAARIAMTLFVTDAVASRKARKTLTEILEAYDASQIALTIVDVGRSDGDDAERHRIIATPTLVRTFPGPRVWIAGELTPRRLVEDLLRQAGVGAKP